MISPGRGIALVHRGAICIYIPRSRPSLAFIFDDNHSKISTIQHC